MNKYTIKRKTEYYDIIEVEASSDDEAKAKARQIAEDPEYTDDSVFDQEIYEIISKKEIAPVITIKLDQTYLGENDATIIWEYTYKGEEMIRERIVGYYHGEPTIEDMKIFAFRGVEGTLDLDGIYD